MTLYKSKLLILLALAILTSTEYAIASDVSKAWSLYKKGDYMGSISLLGEKTEEELYLRWLNEKQIGARADAESFYNPNRRKYYDYVKQHPALFIQDEAHSNYQTSNLRKDQLKFLNPNSIYLAEIRYSGIKNIDSAVWEDGDGSMHTEELIKYYREYLKSYPDSPYRNEIQSRVEEIKKHTLNIKGKLPPGIIR